MQRVLLQQPSFSCFVSSTAISPSLSSTLLQFPIQPGIPVCRTVYVHTWTSTPPAWLVIRAIPSGLEDASETSSPPPSLTVSWLPFDRDERRRRRFASIEREISAKEVLRMVILWLMIINMGRSCDTSLEAGLFKRIILHFISIMLFSLQNLFIIPCVSTSLAEFIDFYAVTFSPKFLSAIAPLKFITLSTFFFFCSLSKFTNPSTFFSLQNFSISNSLLLSQKRTNFSHHAEQS